MLFNSLFVSFRVIRGSVPCMDLKTIHEITLNKLTIVRRKSCLK